MDSGSSVFSLSQSSLNSSIASLVSVRISLGICFPSSRRKIPSPSGLGIAEIGIFKCKKITLGCFYQ